MAVFLKRRATTSGNRYAFTLSAWVKRTELGYTGIKGIFGVPSQFFRWNDDANGDELRYVNQTGSIYWRPAMRDVSDWYHLHLAVDSTCEKDTERVQLWINGAKQDDIRSATYPAEDSQFNFSTATVEMQWNTTGNSGQLGDQQFCDMYYVDDQALPPDIFGYYKKGYGYYNQQVEQTSADASLQTKYVSGQWRPKAPKLIRDYINNGQGWGPNGHYLPGNSKSAPGADWHIEEPDTILKLNKDAPQPRAELPGGKIEVREDPLKDYLVCAIPFVKGGLDNDAGDYSHIIRGNGRPLTVTYVNSPSVNEGVTNIGYGSAMYYDGAERFVRVEAGDHFKFGGDEFTIEGWFWPARNQSNNARLFGIKTNNANHALDMYLNGSSSNADITGGIMYSGGGHNGGPGLPTETWNHVVVQRRGDYLETYVNGVCQEWDDVTGSNFGTSDKYLQIGMIGEDYNQSQYNFEGYIQDVRVYKGIPKYKGSFDCPKHYTTNDFASWRVRDDCPTNNYATLNETMTRNLITYNEGNLRAVSSNASWHGTASTIAPSTGKWYCETIISHNGDWVIPGITRLNGWNFDDQHPGAGSNLHSFGFVFNPSDNRSDITYNGTNSAYTTSLSKSTSADDVVGMAMDLDKNRVIFSLNGVEYYNLSGLLESDDAKGVCEYAFAVGFYDGSGMVFNFGQNPTFGNRSGLDGKETDDNGQGKFIYKPPAGHLALCTANLPEPRIKDPGKYFKPVLYHGTGLDGNKVDSMGFKADLLWIKPRNAADNWVVYNSVRGWNRYHYLNSNTTEAGRNGSGNPWGVLDVGEKGFTLGTWNNLNNSTSQYYLAYGWKAGGRPHNTNTPYMVDDIGYATRYDLKVAKGIDLEAGSSMVVSSASINTESQFSIIRYTGGNGGTLAHGLEGDPHFFMIKKDSGDHWFTYHKWRSGTDHYYMNNANGPGNGIITTPAGGGYVTLANDGGVSASSTSYTAYFWREIEGYSKFGMYYGNGQASTGPFVYCGFRPAMVVCRRMGSTGDHWCVWDSARSPSNPVTSQMMLNETNAEFMNSNAVDFLSNGFRHIAPQGSRTNADNVEYMFMAFAQAPLKYSHTY